MLSTVESFTIMGVQALHVYVEVDVGRGLPSLDVVGLPSASVKEAKERVRTAVRNSGFAWPEGRITVNLAPAHVPKAGTFFDLPIALGILCASGQAPRPERGMAVVGELSLDGRVRPVRGALCIAAAMGRGGLLALPEENSAEVQAVQGLRYHAVRSVRDLVEKLRAGAPAAESLGLRPTLEGAPAGAAWSEVRGQAEAKRALTVAAAGGHHAMLVGPPGAGKTMLARAMAELLAPLAPEEVIEVSAVYSVAGMLTPESPLVLRRPFRSPHHTVTGTALLGGGLHVRPGEVSLAHRGVLFLDEFPEFQRSALEALRQPLEEGAVVVSRASGTHRLPAEFTLVAAANPCPCGYHGDPVKDCRCSEAERRKYRRRFSGPLMDRIDLFVNVKRPPAAAVFGRERHDGGAPSPGSVPASGSAPGGSDEAGLDGKRETDEDWAAQVTRALEAQRRRFGDPRRRNASMTPREMRDFAELDEECESLFRMAASESHLSPRAIHRALKVARTIADLDGRRRIALDDLSEALGYRPERAFS